MATDILGRYAADIGGSFAADSSIMTFGNGGVLDAGVGLLTQQVQYVYQQKIIRLYEVGTRKTYVVAGRTQGSASLARILGPRPVQLAFYQIYGNVANVANNTLAFHAATGNDANFPGNSGDDYNVSLYGVVLEALSGRVAAEDNLFFEQQQITYMALLV